ncbi:MAG: hypothetical protein LBT27_10175 [Prevotellaceae bacterium]|jgi:hypothetical protein|nr:hypothetical protein [Prevotellaceae bacterium]
MKSSEIHIGKLIKQKVKQSSISVSKFARLINRTRPDVYNIFERKSIDVDLLLLISKVLDYNFIQCVYSDNNTEIKNKYILIKFLNEDEIPDELPENTFLLKIPK